MVICKPADPEAKGLIERAHDYLERSFLPGRSFTGPADFNAQLAAWLAVVNTRPRRALGCAPADRIAADKAAMLALPPVAPATGWRASARLARDHYVRLDSNDYSVHPAVIGRRIEVTADLARVRVLCDGQVVADHERAWAWHQTHHRPGAPGRGAGAAPPAGRRVLRPAAEPEVQIRGAGRLRRRAGRRGRGGRVMAAAKTAARDTSRRDRVPDPGAEGTHAARVGAPAGRAGPGRVLDP